MQSFGLLGRKLSHSYSKDIHSVFGDYPYGYFELEEADAARFIKSGEYCGINVTIPYKELAFSLCDEVCGDAKDAKSVNTIVRRGEKLFGYNTDIDGFIGMAKNAGISLTGKKVLILGSGGTSKTARFAAKKEGASEIFVVSRSGELNYENVYELSGIEIIINTTPVGMYPNCGNAPIDLSRFKGCEGVIDVIYNPSRTEFLFDAERLGIKNTGGLYMLAAQGMLASELFFGKELDRSLIQKAVDTVRNKKENIVLIGMPGCGKTSVGRELASLLNRPFFDTDELFKERTGLEPGEVIKTRGEDEMRRTESEIISEIGCESGLVISCGGGICERPENFRPIRRNSRVVYIEREIKLLATEGRPLSKNLDALFEKREKNYIAFSDFSIKNSGTIKDAAKKILGVFGI